MPKGKSFSTLAAKVLALLGSAAFSISSLFFIFAQSEWNEHQGLGSDSLLHALEVDMRVFGVSAIIALGVVLFSLRRLPRNLRRRYGLYSLLVAVTVFGLLFAWFSMPRSVPAPRWR